MRLKLHIYFGYINECIKKACKVYNIEVKEEALALALVKALPPVKHANGVCFCGDMVLINDFDRYIKTVNGNTEVPDKYHVTCSFHNDTVKGLGLLIHIALTSNTYEPLLVGIRRFAVPECLHSTMSEAASKGMSSAIVKAFFGI